MEGKRDRLRGTGREREREMAVRERGEREKVSGREVVRFLHVQP